MERSRWSDADKQAFGKLPPQTVRRNRDEACDGVTQLSQAKTSAPKKTGTLS
jgi:hypothetical protein